VTSRVLRSAARFLGAKSAETAGAALFHFYPDQQISMTIFCAHPPIGGCFLFNPGSLNGA
jgi:hypothetical protein